MSCGAPKPEGVFKLTVKLVEKRQIGLENGVRGTILW